MPVVMRAHETSVSTGSSNWRSLARTRFRHRTRTPVRAKIGCVRTIHAQRTQRERVAHACLQLLAMHELDVLGDKSGLNDTQKIALRTAKKHVGDQVCER